MLTIMLNIHTMQLLVELPVPEGDQLTYSDGRRFSTFDRDLDTSNDHCAQEFGGGWWYGDCMKSNLNGHYINLEFLSAGNTSGIVWEHE